MHAMTGPPAFTLALAAQGITFRMGRRNGRGFATGLQDSAGRVQDSLMLDYLCGLGL